jgi:hypothetical protein
MEVKKITAALMPQARLTLQRQNTEISKEIFPEKEYWASVPISTFMCL